MPKGAVTDMHLLKQVLEASSTDWEKGGQGENIATASAIKRNDVSAKYIVILWGDVAKATGLRGLLYLAFVVGLSFMSRSCEKQ